MNEDTLDAVPKNKTAIRKRAIAKHEAQTRWRNKKKLVIEADKNRRYLQDCEDRYNQWIVDNSDSIISNAIQKALSRFPACVKPTQPTRDTATALDRISTLEAGGATNKAIADTLNNDGITTATGKRWTASDIGSYIHRHKPQGK